MYGGCSIVGHPQVCADVVEALIYAAYETGGLSAAWTFCRIVKLPMPEIAAWTDFATRPVALVAVAYPPAVIEAADDIASRLLKYTFKKPQLLQAALVCPNTALSFSCHRVPDLKLCRPFGRCARLATAPTSSGWNTLVTLSLTSVRCDPSDPLL